MCVYDMYVMYYDIYTHTLMDVCVHLSGQRLGYWSFHLYLFGVSCLLLHMPG